MARDHDIDELKSASLVTSQSFYNKCKSAFKYKDLPSTDWLINLLYPTFQSSYTYYLQGMEIYPEFCLQFYLDKAVQLLKKIPLNYMISFMD